MRSFSKYHPDFEIVLLTGDTKNHVADTEFMRMDIVSGGVNRLYVDSDIEFKGRLPLTTNPGMAFESFPHNSILWSGTRPDLFTVTIPQSIGPAISQLIKMCWRGQGDFLRPVGVYRHWQSDGVGKKARKDLGYKAEDFL